MLSTAINIKGRKTVIHTNMDIIIQWSSHGADEKKNGMHEHQNEQIKLSTNNDAGRCLLHVSCVEQKRSAVL